MLLASCPGVIKGCISSRCKVISDKIEKVETHLHESPLCPSHYDVDVRLLSLHNGDDDGPLMLEISRNTTCSFSNLTNKPFHGQNSGHFCPTYLQNRFLFQNSIKKQEKNDLVCI